MQLVFPAVESSQLLVKNIQPGIGTETNQEGGDNPRVFHFRQDRFVIGGELPPFYFVAEHLSNGDAYIVEVNGKSLREVNGIRPISAYNIHENKYGGWLSQGDSRVMKLLSAEAGMCFSPEKDGDLWGHTQSMVPTP